MIKLLLDTSPLESGHAHRGIGSYTRNLKKYIAKIKYITLVDTVEEADIVHYPFFDFFNHTLPIIKKKPTVVTIHDVIPLQFPEHYPAGIKGSLNLGLQKIAAATTSKIITDSKASAEMIRKYLPIKKNDIQDVYLAANPTLVYSSLTDQKKVAEKYDLPETYLLYVGDINYNKNIPGLLKALSFTDLETKLVCVGKNFRDQQIPEWERITNAIDSHNLKDRVTFLNNVDSKKELAAIYSKAQMYVQPSLAEGFGLPILEALQCHTPVICFNASSMKEVGGEHVVYPETLSAESLSEAIKSVQKWKPNARRKWVLQAYSWSKTFTWKKTAEETAQVYRVILSK